MAKKIKLRIVEGVESVWHYHLSRTGLNGQPALCGNKKVMRTEVPLKCWNELNPPDRLTTLIARNVQS
jgi:hypothetical protein